MASQRVLILYLAFAFVSLHDASALGNVSHAGSPKTEDPPVFRIAMCNCLDWSSKNYFQWHFLEFAAKVALEEGVLEPAVPNWRSFRVEIVPIEEYPFNTTTQSYGWIPFSDLYKAANLVLQDDQNDDRTGNCTATRLRVVTAITGCYGGEATQMLASGTGGFLQVPMISGNAAVNELSDRDLYPMFLRTMPAQSSSTKAVAELCVYFRWLRVGAIDADALSAKYFADHLRLISPNSMLQLLPLPQAELWSEAKEVVAHEFDEARFIGYVQSVVRLQLRIMVLPMSQTSEMKVMCICRYFDMGGLFGPGYVWMFIDMHELELTRELAWYRKIAPDNPAWNHPGYDFEGLPLRLLGSLSVKPLGLGRLFWGKAWQHFWRNLTMDRLRKAGARLAAPESYDPNSTRWKQKSERNHLDYMAMELVVPRYLLHFDAVTTVFAGIGRLLAAGVKPAKIQGQDLYDAMLETRFEGVSGPVAFSRGGDREASYVVSQLKPIYLLMYDIPFSFDNVGVYNSTTKRIEITAALNFSGGAATPPNDTRTPCEAGSEYMGPKLGCTMCPVGTYGPASESSCFGCPAGSASSRIGSMGCQVCTAGFFAPPRSGACNPCPVGTNNGTAAQSQCPCALGWFRNITTDHRECTPCAFGRYTAIEDLPTCSACPAYLRHQQITDTDFVGCKGSMPCALGWFRNITTYDHECTPCAFGRYSATEDTTACSACPTGLRDEQITATDFMGCEPAGTTEVMAIVTGSLGSLAAVFGVCFALYAFRCRRWQQRALKVLEDALGSRSTKKLQAAIDAGDKVHLSRKKMNEAKQKLTLLQHHYTGYESLLNAIDSGDTRLIKGSYIAGQCRRFPRCQDLPPESFWNPRQFQAMSRSVEVVGLSYCWNHPVHPDPLCEVLGVIDRIILLRLAVKGLGSVQDLALFVDYMSLPQNAELGGSTDPQPGQARSPEEHARFKRGLLNVNLWYAHQNSCVWLLKWSPERISHKYMDRGWPFFEQAISAMITDPINLIELNQNTIQSEDWTALLEVSHVHRKPPMLPGTFAQALQQKIFTNGKADLALVSSIYSETFEEAVGCARSLWFVDLNWGDEEAQQIAEMMPFCNRLEQLALQNNGMSSRGVIAVMQAACACSSLQSLDLRGSSIDEATKLSLVEQWQAAGKVAQWLSLSSHRQSVDQVVPNRYNLVDL